MVGDIGTAAPLVCSLAGASAATVCGPVATDVSDVARLVADILAGLPKAAAAPSPGPAGLRYRGCTIVLPAGVEATAVSGRLGK